jgi:hypothetical protein
MKTILIIPFFIGIINISIAQSDTFQTLRNKFGGRENVYSFAASGFLARTVLWVAGEHDYRDAIKSIKTFRFITIPKSAFAEQKVSIKGLKKLILKDSFDELVSVKDHGDNVTVYIQEDPKQKNNLYFLLVDDGNEVIAIEIRGYIDPSVLKDDNHLSYNQ